MVKIGIIGGSGLENPRILKNQKDIDIETKYGKPSSKLMSGTINEIDVVIISRHGKDHLISPSRVNYRANILALKQAGCSHIIATTACGSLREEIKRGDFVILDQFIDFTKLRKPTFYEEFSPNKSGHISMPDPFDKNLRKELISCCKELKLDYHPMGTVITIEGPRFSTRAESKMFRQWGADVINMSIATEAILANEAGLPYAAVAMSTDYDCWKDDESHAEWEEILKVFKKNVEKVIRLLSLAVTRIKK
jgi:5'-methylthioadenosine phosphorylase